MKKGQFMIISAVIASLTIITLSTSISNIQSQTYETEDFPQKVSQLKQEIRQVTEDGTITSKEERNFRKLFGYMENYRTEATFRRGSDPCIQVTLESTDRRVEMPCIS
jgi:hypothetical protein